jgi:hypothetical protein
MESAFDSLLEQDIYFRLHSVNDSFAAHCVPYQLGKSKKVKPSL